MQKNCECRKKQKCCRSKADFYQQLLPKPQIFLMSDRNIRLRYRIGVVLFACAAEAAVSDFIGIVIGCNSVLNKNPLRKAVTL